MCDSWHGTRESCLEENGFAKFSAGPTTFFGAIMGSLNLKVPTLSKHRRSESHVGETCLAIKLPPPAVSPSHPHSGRRSNEHLWLYNAASHFSVIHLWVQSGELGCSLFHLQAHVLFYEMPGKLYLPQNMSPLRTVWDDYAVREGKMPRQPVHNCWNCLVLPKRSLLGFKVESMLRNIEVSWLPYILTTCWFSNCACSLYLIVGYIHHS